MSTFLISTTYDRTCLVYLSNTTFVTQGISYQREGWQFTPPPTEADFYQISGYQDGFEKNIKKTSGKVRVDVTPPQKRQVGSGMGKTVKVPIVQ